MTRTLSLAAIGLSLLAACSEDPPIPADTGTPPDTDVATTTDPTGTAGVFATVVRGELFTSDPVEAQTAHDGLASYGQAAAQAAGDFAHDAMLGTGLLASTSATSFLAIDRWDDPDAMAAFYADPAFSAAFAGLFAGAPTLEAFEQRDDWYGWGTLEAGDPAPEHFFVVARGRLADPDPVAAQAAHDGVASYGEASVVAVGDVAHVVFTGVDDPREFLAIDVWSDDAAIEGVYTDPAFGAAFLSLFEGGVATVQVYGSTDWHQW